MLLSPLFMISCFTVNSGRTNWEAVVWSSLPENTVKFLVIFLVNRKTDHQKDMSHFPRSCQPRWCQRKALWAWLPALQSFPHHGWLGLWGTQHWHCKVQWEIWNFALRRERDMLFSCPCCLITSDDWRLVWVKWQKLNDLGFSVSFLIWVAVRRSHGAL